MNKLFILATFVALVGCSNKPTLSCNDKEVTKLVMEISKKELQEQLFKVFFRNETSILTRDIAEMTYAEFKAKASQTSDPEALGNKVVHQTDRVIAGLNLVDLRLTNKNETTGWYVPGFVDA